MHRVTLLIAALGLVGTFIMGCEPADETPKADTTSTTGSTSAESNEGGSQTDSVLANDQLSEPQQGQVPEGTISVADRKPKDGEEVAVLETDLGKIVLMFFPDKAPNHVENFKKLVKTKFYDGTKFHRTIPGFMIQGGDPNTKSDDRSTWGTGGPKENVKAEFNDIHHAVGVLSMARSQDPDSAGSQFFIMVGDAPFLDKSYSAFGKVVTGQDVANKIVQRPTQGDIAIEPVTIKSAKLVKWPVK